MSRGMRKYSMVLASANEFGGMMQTSALMSTNDVGVEDVGEDLELVADAHVVAVRRHAVRDDAGAHLLVDERVDHPVVARHPPDPRVGSYAHRRKRVSRSVRMILKMIEVASGK